MEEDKSKEGQPSTDPIDSAVDPSVGYVFGLSSENPSTPTIPETTSVPAAPDAPTPGTTPPEPPKESYASLPSNNLPAVVTASKSTEAKVTSSAPGTSSGAAPGAGVPSGGKLDKFAVDEVVSFAWKSMLTFFWPLTGVLTCNFLVQSVPVVTGLVLKYLVPESAGVQLVSGIVSLLGAVVGCIITFGTFNLYLKVADGDSLAVRDVYSKFSRAWNFALASLVYGLMVGAGYVCLLFPGIYLQLRFQFYPYFILDSDASPITALKASWAITKGSAAELFFLWIVNYFIIWVGALCLLIGMFPAHMVQQIALAKAYRSLRRNTPLSDMPPNLMPASLISDSEPPSQLAV